MTGAVLVAVMGNGLVLLGAVIIASAAIGLIRLPDLYTRTSAIGTAAGLGVSLIIVGVVVLDFSPLNLVKGLVAITAQILTSSIGSFALARAGFLTGSTPDASTVPDELTESASGTGAHLQGALPDVEAPPREGET
ncbi:MAG: monovalent cation/H(+) antiporter subunit G [Microcella sp.]|uniref:cation:proton antiporter n=1 Tax=Microcella sp. TaxID=1913979 RepID=UPI003315C8B1